MYGPATWALGHVERWGAILSEANVRRYDTFLEGRIAQHRETLVSAGGEKFREFNPGSPPQMADFLFGQLQLKGKKKTETGKLSTAADVVHELIEGKWGVAFDKATGNPILAPELLAEKRAQNRDLDAVMAVLDLKDAKTQKSKFGVGYLKHIGYDGRVHTKYGIARTLRLTSKEPQLQNLVSPYDSPLIKDEDDPGKWARGVYVPPPGWVILSMDFSQVELRIGAVLSGDPAMAQAFRSGVDFHTATAMRVFSVTNPKDVNKAQRRVAKEVNFSIPYGMTKRGLALKLGITEDKAQEYLDAYDVAYPVFAAWRRRQVAMGYDVGEVLAAFNGWTVRRRVPDLGETGDNPTVRGMKMHGENVCKNTPIQGLANLVCLDAMVRVVRCLLDTRAPAELNMNVHDALVMYVHRDALLPVARQVRSLMTRVDTGAVPLIVDAEVGEADYGHMQKLDLDAAA